MQFRLMYPGFKPKAFTVSYDDGVIQDVRLIEIFNKYSIKGTVNLNSGLQGQEKFRDGLYQEHIDCHVMNFDDYPKLYDNFEIACHTYSHPHLEELSLSKQKDEVKKNIECLNKKFNREIKGFAYPYGTYNKDTIDVLNKLGIKYARTTKATYSFNRPYNFLLWNPTIHHRDPHLFEVMDNFFHSYDELGVFYLWGHGYEFALDDNFDLIERVSKVISSHKEIYLGSNIEICEYIKAAEMVYFKSTTSGYDNDIEEGYFFNPSSKDVYLITPQGNKLVVHPLERLNYHEQKQI